MPQIKRTTLSQTIILATLLLGIGLMVSSAFYASSFLAILGVAIIFWGIILLYITPSKYVPITLVNASAEAAVANIERLILELNLSEVGIYLPPKNLKNIQSSLVFIPQTLKVSLPTPEEITENLFSKEKTGVFITPPGFALSRLFEEELGSSFAAYDLNEIQNRLPKLLIGDLGLAKNIEIQIEGNIITVEITGSSFEEICRQTDFQPKTHKQVGCLLSSSIACVLAKATGKPITIQNETRNQKAETTLLEYKMHEV